jgi:hypothetical protein
VSFIEVFPDLISSIHLTGKVTISRAETSRLDGQEVQVDIATSKGLDVGPIAFRNSTPGQLELIKPALNLRVAQGCIDIRVNIRLSRIEFLDDFIVNTKHFDIQLDRTSLFQPTYDKWDDQWLMYSIINHTRLHSAKGNIFGDGWESRYTDVSTTTGSISGVWPILSALTLETTDGDMIVGYAPQNRSREGFEPPFPWARHNSATASFSATSRSGTIDLEIVSIEGQAKIPDREYITHVQTTSGDISGAFLLGTHGSIRTESGATGLHV